MILVTGGSGLVGQHLIEALTKKGEKVRATFFHKQPSLYTKPDESLLSWMACDVLDIITLEKAFEGITQVYHCAAMVSYDSRHKEEMMRVNIEGTANVVNCCLDAKIDKLCHMSSISTIGYTKPDEMSNEKKVWEEHPHITGYARSKQAAEMEVWRGMAEGLNAVIVNPGIILGEGDDSKSSTNLFNIVYNEFAYYTKGITAWVDVKDVVRIMIALMDGPVSNERFIVSAVNESFLNIFTMMARAMNRRAPHKLASGWMIALVWRFYYLKNLITGGVATITKETAQSAQRIQYVDHRKLFTFLNDFTYTPMEQSIKRICTNYLRIKLSNRPL